MYDACPAMPKDLREVVAESVAYAVCSRFGLDVTLRSVDYVASWSNGGSCTGTAQCGNAQDCVKVCFA